MKVLYLFSTLSRALFVCSVHFTVDSWVNQSQFRHRLCQQTYTLRYGPDSNVTSCPPNMNSRHIKPTLKSLRADCLLCFNEQCFISFMVRFYNISKHTSHMWVKLSSYWSEFPLRHPSRWLTSSLCLALSVAVEIYTQTLIWIVIIPALTDTLKLHL